MKRITLKSVFLVIVLGCSGELFSMNPPKSSTTAGLNEKMKRELDKDKPDFEVIVDAIKAGADPNLTSKDDLTALYLAAQLSDSDAVDRLLTFPQVRSQMNVPMADGWTPLMIASEYSRYKKQSATVVSQLLDAGADPNVAGPGDETALHVAAESGSPEVVLDLLRAGANGNALFLGHTPLDVAKAHKNYAVVPVLEFAGALMTFHRAAADDELIKDELSRPNSRLNVIMEAIFRGGNPNISEPTYGMTPLYLAAALGNVEAVKRLLYLRADKDAALNNGETPLMIAASNGYGVIVSQLLAAGAKVNKVGKFGETELFLAARSGYPGIVGMLLKAGADVNALSDHKTPLNVAMAYKRFDVVDILKCVGAKMSSELSTAARGGIDEQDSAGKTILIKAVENNDPELVLDLLNHGANPLITDYTGRSARDYAQKYPELLRLINARSLV